MCERIAVALLGADPRVRRLPDGRWGLVPEAQGSPLLDDCAFAVVDVETTGMRATRQRPDHRDRGRGRPRRPAGGDLRIAGQSGAAIPPVVSAITSITNDMVRTRRRFDELADQLMAALAGRIFVAHNARFDWGFVSAEMRRARALTLDGHRLCTVRLARRLVSGVRSCGLDSLSISSASRTTRGIVPPATRW